MKHKKDGSELRLMLPETSILGDPWVPIYETAVDFETNHFERAMSNIIKQPNINSTVIMRADVLKENVFDPKGDTMFVSKQLNKLPEFPDLPQTSDNSSDENQTVLYRYYDDVELRPVVLDSCETLNFRAKCEIVRRIIPRNPYKDYIINQTSVILRDESTQACLVVYIPHIKSIEETPFYLPPVHGIALLYHNHKLSIHYMPFDYENLLECQKIRELDPNDRGIRIAMRLVQTSQKHSQGTKDGYEKRVVHDVVVSKESFQNRYISLKKKYSSALVNLWAEKTDPKKHVFEDLAIAAFLIELWRFKYPQEQALEFVDLGCGNGLLVYILHMEGYKGRGIDARARKSWNTYPQSTRDQLYEQIIIPQVLLTDNGKDKYFQIPDIKDNTLMTYHSSSKLMKSDFVCTTQDWGDNVFVIGNHSDELTCWIPLLGYPFLVIPCCSHGLSGAKKRYNSTTKTGSSTYGALVDHVEELARYVGWIVEKESLRIPSTRNAALIGVDKHSKYKQDTKQQFDGKVLEVLERDGGADAWVENSINLMKKPPKDH